MASVILGAISRGFTANQVLRRIANRFPHAANTVFGLQAAGYTANQILRKIYNKSTGKNLSDDAFLTPFEKTRKGDDKAKRNRALAVIGAIGTAGAIAAGAYHLANRNAPIHPTQILPPINRPLTAKQLTNNQKQIATSPSPLLLGNVTPKTPNAPVQPQGGSNLTSNPQSPIISPQSQIQVPQKKNVSASLAASVPKINNVLQSVELIKKMNQENRFNTIISQGYDAETSSELLKMVLPKEVKQSLEKVPGGIQGVVEDYSKYLQEIKQQPQEVQTQEQQIPSSISPESLFPKENIPQQQENNISEEFDIPKLLPEVKNNLTILPKGEIGEIESIKNGVATVNVNGKTHKIKESEIQHAPEGLEESVRHIINSIPENMKSTALQTAIMIPLPEGNVMVTQFYDGKYAWYKDVPEDIYQSISLGTYQPKGQAKTGIGEYNPRVVDSRGAGFHTEIKINPKYSKENKGITWGYADNQYSLLHNIQPILHKISKERYDEQGRFIAKKSRKKST